MSWFVLALLSAFFLGCYDLAKKKSVQDNAVRVTLFFCSAFYALFMCPLLLTGHCESLPLQSHVYLFGKAAIVGGSWSDIWNKCKKVALAAVVVVGVVALSAATAGVAAGVIGAAAGAAGAVAAAAVGGTTTAAVAAASVGTASFVTGAVAGAGLSIKTLIEKS